MLIGEGAEPGEMEKMRSIINGSENVVGLIHMRTNYISPDDMLVAAKVEFASHLSTSELADAINVIEEAIRIEVPHAEPVYIEPDIYRDPQE